MQFLKNLFKRKQQEEVVGVIPGSISTIAVEGEKYPLSEKQYVPAPSPSFKEMALLDNKVETQKTDIFNVLSQHSKEIANAVRNIQQISEIVRKVEISNKAVETGIRTLNSKVEEAEKRVFEQTDIKVSNSLSAMKGELVKRDETMKQIEQFRVLAKTQNQRAEDAVKLSNRAIELTKQNEDKSFAAIRNLTAQFSEMNKQFVQQIAIVSRRIEEVRAEFLRPEKKPETLIKEVLVDKHTQPEVLKNPFLNKERNTGSKLPEAQVVEIDTAESEVMKDSFSGLSLKHK